jgi:DNA-binding transcriptional LysR family regulator
MTLTPALIRLCSRLKMRHMMLLSLLGESPNIRRVAREMSISQASASALLREVEEALGVLMFVREPKGLKATPFGETMIEWADIMLADLDHASADINAHALGSGGRIRIGISALAGTKLLPRVLQLFLQDSPMAAVTVQTGNENMLVPLLLKGELDYVVSRMEPELKHSSIEYEMLYTEDAKAVARTDHPLAGKAHIAAADLDAYNWVLPASKGKAYDMVGACLVAEGAQLPKVVIETWAAAITVSMLQNTDLMAVLPSSIVEQYAANLSVLPLAMPHVYYPVVLLSRPHPFNSLFEQFVRTVRSVAAEQAA